MVPVNGEVPVRRTYLSGWAQNFLIGRIKHASVPGGLRRWNTETSTPLPTQQYKPSGSEGQDKTGRRAPVSSSAEPKADIQIDFAGILNNFCSSVKNSFPASASMHAGGDERIPGIEVLLFPRANGAGSFIHPTFCFAHVEARSGCVFRGFRTPLPIALSPKARKSASQAGTEPLRLQPAGSGG